MARPAFRTSSRASSALQRQGTATAYARCNIIWLVVERSLLRFAAASTPACCRAELAPLRGAPGIQNILPSKLGSTTAGACHQTRSAQQERAHVTWGCSTLLEAVGEDQVIAGAGLDAEIIEIITHVAMNIFTNLLGKATQVEIDFPKIELSRAA